MSRNALLVLLATWLVLVVESNVILRDENAVDGDDGEIDLSDLGLELYGEPDTQVGKLVDNYDPDKDGVNPEELGSYVGGDMLINRPAGRNGLADKSSRWPGGVVPFEINGNFRANEMQMIEDAINQYHKNTCIKFVRHMGERDYISIESSSTGCWSSVGRIGGKQEVNLQMPGCTTKVGTIVHELMHALGFLHEQNRSERDDWVRIQSQNVQRGTENNFSKAKTGTTDGFGVQYDYGSVMHYSANAFSSNGQPTIVAKKSGGNKMGQRNGFSSGDINKLNGMYGCKGVGSSSSISVAPKPQRPASPAASRPNKRPATGPTGAQRSTNGATMGQREGFSRSDIEKLNRMYGCSDGTTTTGTSPPIALPFPIPTFGGAVGLPGGGPSGSGRPVAYPGGPFYPAGYYPTGMIGGYPVYGGYGGPQPYPGGYPYRPVGYPGPGFRGPYGYGYDEKAQNDD